MRCSCVLPKWACRGAAIPTIFVTLDTKSLKESTDRTHDNCVHQASELRSNSRGTPSPAPVGKANICCESWKRQFTQGQKSAW